MFWRMQRHLPNNQSRFQPINLGILLVNRQDKIKVGFSHRTTGTATSPLTTDANRAGSYVRMWSRYTSCIIYISYLLPLLTGIYHLYRGQDLSQLPMVCRNICKKNGGKFDYHKYEESRRKKQLTWQRQLNLRHPCGH